MVFLVAAAMLARKARFPVGFAVLVLLLGTVPILSFVAERLATRRTRATFPELSVRACLPGRYVEYSARLSPDRQRASRAGSELLFLQGLVGRRGDGDSTVSSEAKGAVGAVPEPSCAARRRRRRRCCLSRHRRLRSPRIRSSTVAAGVQAGSASLPESFVYTKAARPPSPIKMITLRSL